MDTLITVTLYAPPEETREVMRECRALLGELDALWSRTREESDVSRFNRLQSGALQLDARTAELMSLAFEVSKQTGGAFDVTVLPLVLYWEECQSKNTLPDAKKMKECRASVGYDRLLAGEDATFTKQNGTQIDLGGIGKGAAISILIDYLKGTSISGGVVSFGSNVAVFGTKPDQSAYRIALRDPFEQNAYAGVLTLSAGEVLSVSGDYERFYTIGGENYHHILDPQSGYPAQSGLSSVAVVCEDGALADALSTALFVMGEEAAQALYRSRVFDFEAIFIASDGTVTQTDGMNSVFTQK